MPDKSIMSSVNINAGLNMGTLEKWLNDIKSTWEIILASVGFALVVGFVYMLVLRCFAGILTWIAIVVYHLALILLGYFFYRKAIDTFTLLLIQKK